MFIFGSYGVVLEAKMKAVKRYITFKLLSGHFKELCVKCDFLWFIRC